jgi:nitrate reductase (cytochrome), electron transfer subunit
MIHKAKRNIILIFLILMVSAIYIIDISIEADLSESNLDSPVSEHMDPAPSETGVFRRSEFSTHYENMPIEEDKQRSLSEYYVNRAFPGAPPIIPHPLLSEEGIGGKSCLQCHENGGYVNQFEAYAPVTPHPELLNCRQCHVKPKTELLFSESDWKKYPHPEIHQSAMKGSPPVIPHDLQLRENCLACHAGPAAPKEILVSHPLRINCRQCHVPMHTNIEWDTVTQWTDSKIEWVRK